LCTESSVDPLLRLRRHFDFLRDEILGYDFGRGCLIGDSGTESADHSEPIREAVRGARTGEGTSERGRHPTGCGAVSEWTSRRCFLRVTRT
jgi:hypothetical protein